MTFSPVKQVNVQAFVGLNLKLIPNLDRSGCYSGSCLQGSLHHALDVIGMLFSPFELVQLHGSSESSVQPVRLGDRDLSIPIGEIKCIEQLGKS